MTRPIVAFLGLGLAVLWIIARCEDATPWLVWFEGALAVGTLAVVWLIPARSSAPAAAGCLAGIALALLALWVIALVAGGTPWFAWWIFTFACLFVATVPVVAFQGRVDAIRTPDEL